MKKIFFLFIGSAFLCACNSPKPEVAQAEAPKSTTFEFADEKYIAIGKQALTELAKGNVDGFVENYSDDARFFWSSGDSLVSKAGIAAYWKDRRAKVIDTITFDNEIWLPVKANQAPPEPGIWLLSWARFSVTYNNGKNLNMYIHHAFHFNDQDKITFAAQYVDRAPIQAALAAKK